MGTLYAQLLLQFHDNCFKTLHALWAWSEDMRVVWNFFVILNVVIFFGHLSEWIEGTLRAQLIIRLTDMVTVL